MIQTLAANATKSDQRFVIPAMALLVMPGCAFFVVFYGCLVLSDFDLVEKVVDQHFGVLAQIHGSALALFDVGIDAEELVNLLFLDNFQIKEV